jgi:outer membrane lipoprotein-sorting protein
MQRSIFKHQILISMKKKLIVFGCALAGLLTGHTNAQNLDETIQKSLSAMGSTKTMTYHFYAQERMEDGTYSKSDVEFKVVASPLKIYANVHLPQSAQVIYDEKVSKEVKVKKGFKLSLSPTNKLLMKGVHNPVTRAGFAQIKKILDKSIAQRKGADLSTFVTILGTVTYDGKECWKVQIDDAEYKIINYTVKAGTTNVWQIGNELAVSEYKIKELNKIGDDVKAGQVLKVPSSYAKRTTLYVDKSNFLPIYHKLEDEKGIFEIYEFKGLKLGMNFTATDFEFE